MLCDSTFHCTARRQQGTAGSGATSSGPLDTSGTGGDVAQGGNPTTGGAPGAELARGGDSNEGAARGGDAGTPASPAGSGSAGAHVVGAEVSGGAPGQGGDAGVDATGGEPPVPGDGAAGESPQPSSGVSENGLSIDDLGAFVESGMAWWVGQLGLVLPFCATGSLVWTAEPIGHPTFKTTGWQLVVAPLGTPEDEFVEAATSWSYIWVDHQLVLLGAGSFFAPFIQHSPPYDQELPLTMQYIGIPSGDHFPKEAWVAPASLTLAGAVVPAEGAPVGSSFDFDSGPIITTRIVVDGSLFKDGELVDPDFDETEPLVDEVFPGTAQEGFSHLPLVFGESTAFIAGDPGSYEFVFTLTDEQTADGWVVHLPFVIE
jgi:hypothetical protein